MKLEDRLEDRLVAGESFLRSECRQLPLLNYLESNPLFGVDEASRTVLPPTQNWGDNGEQFAVHVLLNGGYSQQALSKAQEDRENAQNSKFRLAEQQAARALALENLKRAGRLSRRVVTQKWKRKQRRLLDMLSRNPLREHSLIRVSSAEHISSFPRSCRMPRLPLGHRKRTLPPVGHDEIENMIEVDRAVLAIPHSPTNSTRTLGTREDKKLTKMSPVSKNNQQAVSSERVRHRHVALLHKIQNCDEPSLSLRHQGLTTDIFEVVWQALVANSFVVDLDLAGNILTAVAVQSLCALVLSESDLSDHNWIAHAKSSPLPLLDQSLIGAKRSCIIRSLDLASTHLELKQVGILCETVRSSTVLRNLSLRNNALGDGSARLIARMLIENKSIAKLDLCENVFTWRSAPDIAKALGRNKTLCDLGLGWNNLRGTGGYVVLKHIKENTSCTLRHLDLSFNGLDNTTGLKLCKLIKKNKVPTVTTLNVSHNRMGRDTGVALAEAIKSNIHLITFHVGYNPFGLHVTRQIIYGAELHPRLRHLGLENCSIKTSSRIDSKPAASAMLKSSDALDEAKIADALGHREQESAHGDRHFQLLWEEVETMKARRHEKEARELTIFIEFPPVARKWSTGAYGPDFAVHWLAEVQLGLLEKGIGIGDEQANVDEDTLDKEGELEVDTNKFDKCVFSSRAKECDAQAYWETPELLNDAFKSDWSVIEPKLVRIVKDQECVNQIGRLFRENFEEVTKIYAYYGALSASRHYVSSTMFKEFLSDCRVYRDPSIVRRSSTKTSRKMTVDPTNHRSIVEGEKISSPGVVNETIADDTEEKHCETGNTKLASKPKRSTTMKNNSGKAEAIQIGMVFGKLKSSIVDNVFIAANVRPKSNSDPKRETNSDKSLTRFEFLEAIVRIAQNLAPDGGAPALVLTLRRFMEHNVETYAKRHDSNAFRTDVVYRCCINQVLRVVLPQLQHVFMSFSGRNALPGGTHLASFPEYCDMLLEAGMLYGLPGSGGDGTTAAAPDVGFTDAQHSPNLGGLGARKKSNVAHNEDDEFQAKVLSRTSCASVHVEVAARAFRYSNMVLRDEMDHSRSQKNKDLCNELTFSEFLESIVYLAWFVHDQKTLEDSSREDDELEDPVATSLVRVLRSLFSIGRKSRSSVWLDFFDSEVDPWSNVDLGNTTALVAATNTNSTVDKEGETVNKSNASNSDTTSAGTGQSSTSQTTAAGSS